MKFSWENSPSPFFHDSIVEGRCHNFIYIFFLITFILRIIYSSTTANFQTLRPSFCTSSSSRRCSRAPRCRSSASRWATLRRTSPGPWMGFLFRKTTGRTSSFPRANVSSENGGYTVPKLDLYLLPFTGRRFMVSKIDGHMGRLFAVINPGVLREIIVGNRCGSFYPTEANPVGEPR